MLEALAPVLGVSIVALTACAAVVLRGPLGRALAERLAGRGAHEEADGLRADVEHLRVVVADLEERLDFAERLLAQQRERQALPDGGAAGAQRSR